MYCLFATQFISYCLSEKSLSNSHDLRNKVLPSRKSMNSFDKAIKSPALLLINYTAFSDGSLLMLFNTKAIPAVQLKPVHGWFVPNKQKIEKGYSIYHTTRYSGNWTSRKREFRIPIASSWVYKHWKTVIKRDRSSRIVLRSHLESYSISPQSHQPCSENGSCNHKRKKKLKHGYSFCFTYFSYFCCLERAAFLALDDEQKPCPR